MFNKYLAIYETTLVQYRFQNPRAGYSPGIFCFWRHSCEEYQALKDLRQNIINAQDPSYVIDEFLSALNNQEKIYNYSFASYFLDQLTKGDPNGKWEKFYPPEQKICFYQGQLYRGMCIDRNILNSFFDNGIIPRERSKNIQDYISDASLSMGISTSKNKKLASGYASKLITRNARESARIYTVDGYLLDINYRGIGGIDILPTLKARRKNFQQWMGKDKEEVNIIGEINASDIKGAWKVDYQNGIGKYIKNPSYNEILSNDIELPQPIRLSVLFSS